MRLSLNFTKITCVLLISGFVTACGSSDKNSAAAIDLDKDFPSESGGSLINAMTGEPSSLISMIAGESASSAISSNIFN
ncbi:MAG: peptide-binding protein, partial [Methylotenera sp.]